MIRVTIEPRGIQKPLKDIPNGTFFMGAIEDSSYGGPFLKVGSVGERVWIVVRLGLMEGFVYVSTRQRDAEQHVRDFHQLNVAEVILSCRNEHARTVVEGVASVTGDGT